MRKGGGKQKGAAFERDICRRLSLWVSANKQEDVFWRSAMSGGRSTVAFAKGKRMTAQAGDISCVHPVGQPFAEVFFAECKFYADLNFSGLITGTGKLLEFWAIAKREAGNYGKMPIMFVKQNRMPVLVCLTHSGMQALGLRKTQAILYVFKPLMYLMDADVFFKKAKI